MAPAKVGVMDDDDVVVEFPRTTVNGEMTAEEAALSSTTPSRFTKLRLILSTV
jgi:hypothetical protein